MQICELALTPVTTADYDLTSAEHTQTVCALTADNLSVIMLIRQELSILA